MITIVLVYDNVIQYKYIPTNSTKLVTSIKNNKPMKVLVPLTERANMRLIKFLNELLHPLSSNGLKYY